MIAADMLKLRITEEKEDMAFYKKVAEENPEYHHIFCDIAKDEESHAAILEHILESLK